MAHLFKQPELSRGNENFHLCRAAQILRAKSPLTSSLAQSLSSVSTAGAPGPVSPPLPICTRRPRHGTKYKSLHSFRWKIKVLNVSVFLRRNLVIYKRRGMRPNLEVGHSRPACRGTARYSPAASCRETPLNLCSAAQGAESGRLSSPGCSEEDGQTRAVTDLAGRSPTEAPGDSGREPTL